MSSGCYGFAHRKARRDHFCDYCADTIPTGSTYRRWSWICDGSASTLKAHPVCDAAAQSYYDEVQVWPDERYVTVDALDEWAAPFIGGGVEADALAVARAVVKLPQRKYRFTEQDVRRFVRWKIVGYHGGQHPEDGHYRSDAEIAAVVDDAVLAAVFVGTDGAE